MNRREWSFAGIVAAMAVGVIWGWVAPINIEVQYPPANDSADYAIEVVPCDPLVPERRTIVDDEETAFTEVDVACQVQRGNRSLAIQLAATAVGVLAVGGIVVLRGRHEPGERGPSAHEGESDG